MLVHNCAILGITVDSHRLYSGVDPDYELFLRAVVERVSDTNERAAPKQQ